MGLRSRVKNKLRLLFDRLSGEYSAANQVIPNAKQEGGAPAEIPAAVPDGPLDVPRPRVIRPRGDAGEARR
jgi:hypothetical protein